MVLELSIPGLGNQLLYRDPIRRRSQLSGDRVARRLLLGFVLNRIRSKSGPLRDTVGPKLAMQPNRRFTTCPLGYALPRQLELENNSSDRDKQPLDRTPTTVGGRTDCNGQCGLVLRFDYQGVGISERTQYGDPARNLSLGIDCPQLLSQSRFTCNELRGVHSGRRTLDARWGRASVRSVVRPVHNRGGPQPDSQNRSITHHKRSAPTYSGGALCLGRSESPLLYLGGGYRWGGPFIATCLA